MGVVEPDANGVLARLLDGVADMTRAILAVLEVNLCFTRAWNSEDVVSPLEAKKKFFIEAIGQGPVSCPTIDNQC